MVCNISPFFSLKVGVLENVFLQTIDDPTASRKEVIGHLKKAAAYHHTYKLEAMNGQAADRHMFGLHVASKFAGLKPKLFEHKVGRSRDLLVLH